MDLMRRAAAGELAELVGSAALPMDKQRRPFRMRSRTAQVLADAAAEDRAALNAYSEGVNAGFEVLGSRPGNTGCRSKAESCGRRRQHSSWMRCSFDLRPTRELGFVKIRAALPESAKVPSSASGGPWDAPLFGPSMLPVAAALQRHRPWRSTRSRCAFPPKDGAICPGSNSFAVNGALTSTQAALVANHAPEPARAEHWFRARLV